MITVTDVAGKEDSFGSATGFEADSSGRLYVRGAGGVHAVYAQGRWASAWREEDAPAEEGSESDAATTIDAK